MNRVIQRNLLLLGRSALYVLYMQCRPLLEVFCPFKYGFITDIFSTYINI
jgi:hypothetical protein